MPNSVISQITLPSGQTYDIKDAYAREQIATLSEYTKYLGVSDSAIEDGSSTATITIAGDSVTATRGAIATYQNKEYIFNGTVWQEFGDLSGLGNLAYINTVDVAFTPAGTVSQPTFTGSESNVNVSIEESASGNYTPAGTISQPSFSGSATTFSGSYTPAGSISFSNTNKTAIVGTAAGEATYTPSGTVTSTFSGTGFTASGNITPQGSIENSFTGSATTFSGSYTPAGTVGTPTISVQTAGSTTTIKNPTKETVVKTVVAGGSDNNISYYSVSGETLTLKNIGYTTGDSISTDDVTVKTGDAAYQSSQPSWTGTAATIQTSGTPNGAVSSTFSGAQGSVSISGTPSGTVTSTFTGSGVHLVTGNISVPNSASFSGTEATIDVSGTPNGSVSQPTFSGTKVLISGKTTASGSVSQPTFNGTAATVSGTPHNA